MSRAHSVRMMATANDLSATCTPGPGKLHEFVSLKGTYGDLRPQGVSAHKTGGQLRTQSGLFGWHQVGSQTVGSKYRVRVRFSSIDVMSKTNKTRSTH